VFLVDKDFIRNKRKWPKLFQLTLAYQISVEGWVRLPVNGKTATVGCDDNSVTRLVVHPEKIQDGEGRLVAVVFRGGSLEDLGLEQLLVNVH
jgi:hypothetical protein